MAPTASMSAKVIPASTSASPITPFTSSRCARLAISGTTPPKRACRSTWLAITLARIVETVDHDRGRGLVAARLDPEDVHACAPSAAWRSSASSSAACSGVSMPRTHITTASSAGPDVVALARALGHEAEPPVQRLRAARARRGPRASSRCSCARSPRGSARPSGACPTCRRCHCGSTAIVVTCASSGASINPAYPTTTRSTRATRYTRDAGSASSDRNSECVHGCVYTCCSIAITARRCFLRSGVDLDRPAPARARHRARSPRPTRSRRRCGAGRAAATSSARQNSSRSNRTAASSTSAATLGAAAAGPPSSTWSSPANASAYSSAPSPTSSDSVPGREQLGRDRGGRLDRVLAVALHAARDGPVPRREHLLAPGVDRARRPAGASPATGTRRDRGSGCPRPGRRAPGPACGPSSPRPAAPCTARDRSRPRCTRGRRARSRSGRGGTRSPARAPRRAGGRRRCRTSPSTRPSRPIGDADLRGRGVDRQHQHDGTSARRAERGGERRRRVPPTRRRRVVTTIRRVSSSASSGGSSASVTSRRSAGSSSRTPSPHSITHHAVVEHLLEPEVDRLLHVVEPVHVEVADRQPALVLAQQRERGAHHRLLDAERRGDRPGRRRSCRCRGRR